MDINVREGINWSHMAEDR